MQTYDNYINGKWQAPSNHEYVDVINPANEEVVAQVAYSEQKDVDTAVAAAKAAFPAWNKLSKEERKEYMVHLLDVMKKHEQDIADTILKELGASRTFCEKAQAPMSINEMEATLKAYDAYNFTEELDHVTVMKEGFGVVACITPWNYPFNQIQRKITPALLAGNTVVVKPASNTPLSAVLYAEIIEEAGLPKGVFNLVMGSGSGVGDYLASHEDVAVISFTGSTAVGKGLYEKAAPHVKKLVLELGGKSALLALPGSDKQAVVKKAAGTVLNNQGQTCSALTRLLVPTSELNEYKEVILDFYKENAKVGNPEDADTMVGPMVSQDQKETVLEYIEKGRQEGANLLLGGNDIDRPGFYVEPTVFTEVTNDMTIAREEIFGPVLSVLTYETVEEAIEIANDSPYGLSGAVFGPNHDEAVEVAKQLRTGQVFINTASGNPAAPFGGYKESGLGRENGKYGLEDYLEVKAIFKEN